MERKRSKQASSMLSWACFLLLSQNLLLTVTCALNYEDEKNFFYYPDPHATTPPTVSYTPPAHGSGSGGHTTPTVPAPVNNCGSPPSGAHQHHPTPSPPKGSSGGYYHHSPPKSTPTTKPPTVTPPTTPIVTPTTPSTPGIMTPSPPFPFDPNSPPFTCTYWRNHPTLVWGVFGYFGTVGNAFGVSSLPGFGAHMNLLEALSNTRTDGIGKLCRQGTAALLNSMADTKFPYTSTQVRDSFVAALSSDKAASAQAQLFKVANEGRIKPRA